MRERARRGVRSRGLAFGVVVLAVGFATLASGASASIRISLRPGSGGVHTRFVLRFRNPSRTGMTAGFARIDRVLVSGPRGTGCVASVTDTLRPAAAGAAIKATIAPGSRRHWCDGRFSGRLIAYQSIICNPSPARACPQLVIAPRTLARFRFRVQNGPSGGSGGTGGPGSGGGGSGAGDTPAFSGLQSVVTCDATPVHSLGPDRTYTLSWSAASDPVTPSAQIVYDIYYSSTPGGENYATPTWTTALGATAYSGKLATSSAAYFVVRARNQAGHEDANTVEKLAVNQC